MAVSDDERAVELTDDDLAVLPDQTSDESDIGWGEASDTPTFSSFPPAARPRNVKGRRLSARDIELLEDRPPHWG